MPVFSTNCCISAQARDQITPLPEMITGFLALDMAWISASTCSGSPSGRALRMGRPLMDQSTSSSGILA